MNNHLVTIKTFSNYIEAHLFRIELLSKGLESYVFDENFVTTNIFLSFAVGGIKVKISKSDLDKVRGMDSELNETEEYKGHIYENIYKCLNSFFNKKNILTTTIVLITYFLIGIIITIRYETKTERIYPDYRKMGKSTSKP